MLDFSYRFGNGTRSGKVVALVEVDAHFSKAAEHGFVLDPFGADDDTDVVAAGNQVLEKAQAARICKRRNDELARELHDVVAHEEKLFNRVVSRAEVVDRRVDAELAKRMDLVGKPTAADGLGRLREFDHQVLNRNSEDLKAAPDERNEPDVSRLACAHVEAHAKARLHVMLENARLIERRFHNPASERMNDVRLFQNRNEDVGIHRDIDEIGLETHEEFTADEAERAHLRLEEELKLPEVVTEGEGQIDDFDDGKAALNRHMRGKPLHEFDA